MYTAIKLGDTIDRRKQRRIVTVRFTEGESSFDKDFEFNISATVEDIKRRVKSFLEEINYVPPTVADGELDLTVNEPEAPAPNADDLAKQAWQADWAKLQTVQQLIAAGVLTGTETAVTTLRNRVRTNFKPSYL